MKVNVLIDNHLHAGMQNYDLADFSIGALETFVDSVKPSRLTVFAIGHDGLAQYPSRIAKVAPGLKIDMVQTWKKIARNRGISFGLYVSTLRNDVLLSQKPDWVRYRLDGTTSAKIDHTSPFLEEWLIPVLDELHSLYSPDGFFFDGDYWAVGDGTGPYRSIAAQSMWPERGIDALQTLTAAEHRQLTVETYGRYLRGIGAVLCGLDAAMANSVNLAFTFRHPTDPPPGLSLVTSDLPPFFGALESWIETAVLLPDNVHRDLVVPLYTEPEGGGRKYQKSVPQLVHETAPLIANGEDIHVYFPMSRRGGISPTYIGNLNEMRREIERQVVASADADFRLDHDVLCLSDTDTLQSSQEFSALRGSFLSACAAGLNAGVGTTKICRDRLSHIRMLVVPDGEPRSVDAKRLVDEAMSQGIEVLGPYDSNFPERMRQANREIDANVLNLFSMVYKRNTRDTVWSKISINRPWSTFIRGLIGQDGRWRLFLWNGIKVGGGRGRHVLDGGAGYAGAHTILCQRPLVFDKVWGYSKLTDFYPNATTIEIHGAYAVIDGSGGTAR